MRSRQANGSLLLRTLAIVSAATAPPAALAQTETFALDARHAARLGIVLRAAERVEEIEIASAPGQVVVPPAQQALAAAPVSGSIARLLVAEGETVRAGQPLAELDSAELLELEHAFLDALAAEELASAQETRDRALYVEGIIAERRLQETATAARAARAALDQARKRLELAGFDSARFGRLAERRALDSRLTIRAPIAGVVAAVHAAVGTRLDALDPLLTIADLTELWIELRLGEQSAARVEPGMTIAGTLGGASVTGTVTTVGRVVDRVTQTVLVRAAIATPPAALRAGQFLVTRVLARPPGGAAFAVPVAAITRHDGRTYVFVRRGGEFVAEPVTVLAEGSDRIYLSERLDAEIAVEGVSALKALWLGGDEDS